ncbi:MAG: Sua5 family C-terminal domain-containing protein, partial [Atribacterota bacterium]|nr:Sua5 family C-terminal domain-containing protein [Atribacterota bacterium]
IAIVSPFPIADSREEIKVLSEKGDIREVASNLFSVLRELEEGPFRAIISLTVEEKGLGRAIMDRLKRASSGYARVRKGKLVF